MDSREIVQCSAEKLPIDLIIEIVSRLPAKSVASCRCVSKQWDSILVSQVFRESFLAYSLSRPCLLFLLQFSSNRKCHFFFSSPQPQKFGGNIVATEFYMGSYENCRIQSCQSIHGFIYLRYWSNGTTIDRRSHVIYNPCTRQYITLPKLETRSLTLESFFVYDPIQKQFKVLCIYSINRGYEEPASIKYQVLTLGTGELLWRKIKCPFPYYPQTRVKEICVNGVLYYKANIINGNSYDDSKIVCFNVSSEKFSIIEIEKAQIVTLINYKGKLGVLVYIRNVSGRHAEVWVLDDTNKVKWSKHIIVFPKIISV